MPPSVVAQARKAGVHVHQCESVEEVLSETDVLYVTRVQRERFADDKEWERVKDVYRVDHERRTPLERAQAGEDVGIKDVLEGYARNHLPDSGCLMYAAP